MSEFIIRFKYDPKIVEQIRQLPAGDRKWNPDEKCWAIASGSIYKLADLLVPVHPKLAWVLITGKDFEQHRQLVIISDDEKKKLMGKIQSALSCFDEGTRQLVHYKLKVLAGMCDGAETLDGCGFSKMDAGIGHSLAEQSRLTDRQVETGLKLVSKYRRQVGHIKEIN